jgi:methylthioribose-1-phosphate isomerase
MLRPITWTGSSARLLDQTKLPAETVYLDITDERQMHDAIRRLVVRGAPAIGIAAAFGVYLGVRDDMGRLNEVCDYLATSRPTAVNLFWAIDRIKRIATSPQRILDECLAMIDEDDRVNRAIGVNGLAEIAKLKSQTPDFTILTHCNAGGLASAGFGMALAPIYVGAEQGKRFHVYADETRPLLQGSRITAYELQANGIPVTVICDSMAAAVMSQKKIDACIVGADRIAANGDTANKIGTLAVAIAAKHFGVPFFVAAPTSTVDLKTPTGAQIPIEQRSGDEVLRIGDRATAPAGVEAFNPAFDVTPADLITAIITEHGVARAPFEQSLSRMIPARAARGGSS